MNKYLPSLTMISQQTVCTAVAMILFALIVAKTPALRALVKNYDLPT